MIPTCCRWIVSTTHRRRNSLPFASAPPRNRFVRPNEAMSRASPALRVLRLALLWDADYHQDILSVNQFKRLYDCSHSCIITILHEFLLNQKPNHPNSGVRCDQNRLLDSNSDWIHSDSHCMWLITGRVLQSTESSNCCDATHCWVR